MKIFSSFFFIFLYFSLICSEDNLTVVSQQAQALWEAHDETEASHLYEPLLSHSLPPWQQARVFYNLGTIRLSQQQTSAALTFFQKIIPTDLSLPQFGRDLLLNEGIAYLQYAQTFSHSSSVPFLDEQALLIEQSLQAFHQSQQLDCRAQLIEQKDSLTCLPYPLLNQWIAQAHCQLQTIDQQKRQEWIEQASKETLASLLYTYLQEFIGILKDFELSKNPSFFFDYFQHQAESFIPIWNALQKKSFSPTQKIAFDQAITFYLNALQNLHRQDLTSTIKEFNQGIEALFSLTFQENSAFHYAHLNYEVILLQENLSLFDLKSLKERFDQLKVEKNQMSSLKRIQENLQMSIEELKLDHPLHAHFFLLAGFSQTKSLFKNPQMTPTIILQHALEHAHLALQLFFLSILISEEAPQKTSIQAILKNQQQEVLTQATFFIPAVLEEQKTLFQQAKDPHSTCQQFPWEQVIPLFDHGYQLAHSLNKQFNLAYLDVQEIENKQEKTIKDWQQALNILLHPPQPSPTNSDESQHLTNTFSLIQEMYLQDQSSPEQPLPELHTW